MTTGYTCAAAMLPMPRTAGLASEQMDGTVCVWCARTPDGGGIVLGPRISVIGGSLRRWEPRACRPCASRQAARVYGIHIGTCARCSHGDFCPDSHALHRLALECRPLDRPSTPAAPASGENT